MKVLAEVAKEAFELPAAERLTLARMLLEGSEPVLDFSPEVEAAWEEEIVRRIGEVKAGNAIARPIEEVFADLDRRFPS